MKDEAPELRVCAHYSLKHNREEPPPPQQRRDDAPADDGREARGARGAAADPDLRGGTTSSSGKDIAS